MTFSNPLIQIHLFFGQFVSWQSSLAAWLRVGPSLEQNVAILQSMLMAVRRERRAQSRVRPLLPDPPCRVTRASPDRLKLDRGQRVGAWGLVCKLRDKWGLCTRWLAVSWLIMIVNVPEHLFDVVIFCWSKIEGFATNYSVISSVKWRQTAKISLEQFTEFICDAIIVRMSSAVHLALK